MHKQSLNQAWRFYLGDVPRFFRQPIDYSTWRVLFMVLLADPL